jgi:hypothetical protein
MKLINKHVGKISIFIGSSLLFASCSQYDNNQVGKENSTTEETAKAVVSGEDLFKSIFFGIGEFANNIPQLKSKIALNDGLTKDKKKDVEGKMDILTSEIAKNDPNFFNEFKTKILSGNHQDIKYAMEEGSHMLQKNIEIIFPEFNKVFKKVKKDINSGKLKFNEKENFKTYVNTFQKAFDNGDYDKLLNENMISTNKTEESTACSWALGCVVYVALAVHNTIAVTALIYFQFAFWGPSASSGGGGRVDEEPFRSPHDAELKTEMLINEIADYQN